MKTMNKFLILAFTFVALLVPTMAHAEPTAELQGYVVDGSGLPVVGVRVIITSPQMIGGEKVIETDQDGRFRFANLEVGTYAVTLSHPQSPGFEEEHNEVGIHAKVIR